MNKTFAIYEQRGLSKSEFLAEFTFAGEPQNGDTVDLGDDGVVIISRRWTSDGQLVLDARREGMRQVSRSVIKADRGSRISGVTQVRT